MARALVMDPMPDRSQLILAGIVVLVGLVVVLLVAGVGSILFDWHF